MLFLAGEGSLRERGRIHNNIIADRYDTGNFHVFIVKPYL
jgi:hypothetical protein